MIPLLLDLQLGKKILCKGTVEESCSSGTGTSKERQGQEQGSLLKGNPQVAYFLQTGHTF